jgi:glycogen operon protein
MRRDHIVFHRHRFFRGKAVPGTEVRDITWLRPDGQPMGEDDWHGDDERSIGLLLSGEPGAYHMTVRGEQEPDDSFLVILNASDAAIAYALPERGFHSPPEVMLNTAAEPALVEDAHTADAPFEVARRSLVVLRFRRPGRKDDGEDAAEAGNALRSQHQR